MSDFSDRLRGHRIAKDLNQAELGRRAGFDHSTISYFESGARTPQRDSVAALAKGLGLTPAEHDRLLWSLGYAPRDLGSVMADPLLAELDDLVAAAPPDLADNVRGMVRVLVDYARRAYAADPGRDRVTVAAIEEESDGERFASSIPEFALR